MTTICHKFLARFGIVSGFPLRDGYFKPFSNVVVVGRCRAT